MTRLSAGSYNLPIFRWFILRLLYSHSKLFFFEEGAACESYFCSVKLNKKQINADADNFRSSFQLLVVLFMFINKRDPPFRHRALSSSADAGEI